MRETYRSEAIRSESFRVILAIAAAVVGVCIFVGSAHAQNTGGQIFVGDLPCGLTGGCGTTNYPPPPTYPPNNQDGDWYEQTYVGPFPGANSPNFGGNSFGGGYYGSGGGGNQIGDALDNAISRTVHSSVSGLGAGVAGGVTNIGQMVGAKITQYGQRVMFPPQPAPRRIVVETTPQPVEHNGQTCYVVKGKLVCPVAAQEVRYDRRTPRW